MIDPLLRKSISDYWASVGVFCLRASVDDILEGAEIAEIWRDIGIPEQDWWQFSFFRPLQKTELLFHFGKLGDWELVYDRSTNFCSAETQDSVSYFANSSFLKFARFLTLFDQGCKRIQTECPGDSGDEWDKGDVIIQEMESQMRILDPKAFALSENFWPYLLIDING